MRFIIVLTVAITLAFPAISRDIVQAELSALRANMAEFVHALETKRMLRVMATVPPSVMAQIAKNAGTTPKQLIREIANDMKDVMEDVQFLEMDIRTDGLDVRGGKSTDGTQVIFTFVPMNFEMDVKGSHFKVTSSVLALLENGTWYFLRVEDEEQRKILEAIYPFFRKVQFPVGEMTQTE
ncbi:MAG: hypothetical protein V3V25_02715 [Paracoccaceae bacterium]